MGEEYGVIIDANKYFKESNITMYKAQSGAESE